MKKFACVAVFAVLLFSGAAFSQSLFTYEGKLYSAQGVPYTGQAQLTFRIYNSDTGGTPLWEETQVVDVLNGNFSAVLGYSMPLTTVDFSQSPLYLAVEVNNDGEMTPRILLTDVPKAVHAEQAGSPEMSPRMNLCHYSDFSCNLTMTGNDYRPLEWHEDVSEPRYITVTNPSSETSYYTFVWIVGVSNTNSNQVAFFWVPTVDGRQPANLTPFTCVIPPLSFSWYEYDCSGTVVIPIEPGTHEISIKAYVHGGPITVKRLHVYYVRGVK